MPDILIASGRIPPETERLALTLAEALYQIREGKVGAPEGMVLLTWDPKTRDTQVFQHGLTTEQVIGLTGLLHNQLVQGMIIPMFFHPRPR